VTEPSRDGRARPFVAWRDGSILRLRGDIDQVNWLAVAESVAAELRTGAVELDLTGVGFFGAAGVRAVLHACAASPSPGPLRLTCSEAVFRVLTICGLKKLDGVDITRDGARPKLPPRTDS
jgi:anti-anti-sigma factor